MSSIQIANRVLLAAAEGIAEQLDGLRPSPAELTDILNDLEETGEIAGALAETVARFQAALLTLQNAPKGLIAIPAPARELGAPERFEDGQAPTPTAAAPAAELIPFELPKSGTVQELLDEGGELLPQTVASMEAINTAVPLVGLNGLTPQEIERIRAFVEENEGHARDTLAEKLVDFAHTIVRAGRRLKLGDDVIRAAKEIIKQEKGARGTYTPQEKTLSKIARATLTVARNLLKRSLDADLLDPTGALEQLAKDTRDIDLADPRQETTALTILVLQVMQEVDAQSRQPQLIETLRETFDDLIKFHAETMIKLQKQGRKLVEFAGDQETSKELISQANFLKSVSSYMRRYGRITPDQKSKALELFHNYREMMEFLVNENEEFRGIVMEPLNRPEEETATLATELRIRLNDKKGGRRRSEMASRGVRFDYQTINQILIHMGFDGKVGETTPLDPKKQSYICHETAIIPTLEKYRSMNADDREKLKASTLLALDQTEQAVVEAFFTIMEEYID